MAIAGCDRVVQYEPSPDKVLPPGVEVLARATSTTPGSGTEYHSVYWLVGLDDHVNQDGAIDGIVERLLDLGFETLDKPAHDWASVSLIDDQHAYVAIGAWGQFLEKDTDLGPETLASFEDSARDDGDSTVVILFVPT